MRVTFLRATFLKPSSTGSSPQLKNTQNCAWLYNLQKRHAYNTCVFPNMSPHNVPGLSTTHGTTPTRVSALLSTLRTGNHSVQWHVHTSFKKNRLKGYGEEAETVNVIFCFTLAKNGNENVYRNSEHTEIPNVSHLILQPVWVLMINHADKKMSPLCEERSILCFSPSLKQEWGERRKAPSALYGGVFSFSLRR